MLIIGFHPRHETRIGVRFAGPDKLVHLVGLSEVVSRLGRGVAERLPRPIQIAANVYGCSSVQERPRPLFVHDKFC